MNGEYIKFGSVTIAQKAQRILSQKGIKSRVGKNPDPKRSEGCGYALYVADAQGADVTLKLNGVLSKGIGRLDSR